jgi:hypothetical protein
MNHVPLSPVTRVVPSASTSMMPPVPRMPTVAVGVWIWYALRFTRPISPVTVRIAPRSKPKMPFSLPSVLPS